MLASSSADRFATPAHTLRDATTLGTYTLQPTAYRQKFQVRGAPLVLLAPPVSKLNCLLQRINWTLLNNLRGRKLFQLTDFIYTRLMEL